MSMIPKARLWRVTFHLKPEYARSQSLEGTTLTYPVLCVKRFAKQIANEQCGYLAFHCDKITVGLSRK